MSIGRGIPSTPHPPHPTASRKSVPTDSETGAGRWWRILLRQFADPHIFALAAIVSLAIGEVVDALFIGLVLGVNAAIGDVQKWQAERSSQVLKGLIRTRATVLRDGEPRDVDGDSTDRSD